MKIYLESLQIRRIGENVCRKLLPGGFSTGASLRMTVCRRANMFCRRSRATVPARHFGPDARFLPASRSGSRKVLSRLFAESVAVARNKRESHKQPAASSPDTPFGGKVPRRLCVPEVAEALLDPDRQPKTRRQGKQHWSFRFVQFANFAVICLATGA